VAGGTSTETGFLVDISANDVERCMRNNYLTSAYSTQTILKVWTQDDEESRKKNKQTTIPQIRRIIFVSSAAAFVGLPGYIAYTRKSCLIKSRTQIIIFANASPFPAAKCAVRAFADTLRSEVLRYSGAASTYTIHCAFPSNFVSPAFIDEQKSKPDLTKRIEGTEASASELERKLHSSEQVAKYIIGRVGQGDFAICSEFEAAVLFANMMGPSPKRGFGIVDSFLALLMTFFIWPVVRRRFDSMCVADGNVRHKKIVGV
jgi:3-dehydrosphinganine reductase